jgi:hypothetical protein
MENLEGEIWKDIPGYEGLYQASNLGRVKSLDNKVLCRGGAYRIKRGKILSPYIHSDNYCFLTLYDNKIQSKRFSIHQLVAIAFLNHKPNGFKLVINHKDFDRTNNNVNNLEIVTQRQNTNLKHIPHSSQYTGVSWDNKFKRWKARIYFNKKDKHIGYYKNEYEAHLAYEKVLEEINSTALF